ncbi:MAG: BatA domain-containing protein [bacterium]
MFGLSFLNSLFLWGAFAAAIPLILHLIKRNRAVKLPFAAMRFLLVNPNQRVKSQKLKQFILLLLRMTALALLALAFARPFFQSAESGKLWGTQPQTAVILVDNSLSMAYEDKFKKASAKAKEVLASFNSGDEVAVMQFAETSTVVGETNSEFELLANQLDTRLKLSNSGTHFSQAFQAAESHLLESALPNKIIYLISDLQKTGLQNIYSHLELQPGIRLELIPIQGESVSNIAISEVLITQKDEHDSKKNILARLKNFGSEKKRVVVSMNINGRKAAKKKVTLLAREEKVVNFHSVKLSKGRVRGFIMVQAEESIDSDNRFYFVAENRTKMQILAVNGEPDLRDATADELFFLRKAIDLDKLAKYTLVETTPQNSHSLNFNSYRVVILANVKDLSRQTIERLLYFVRAGGGLVITLGDQTNPAIFNRLFRELSPATVSAWAFDALQRENGVILAEVEYQHPVFRIFSDPGNGDPSTAQFYQYFLTEPMVPQSVIAYFDDGNPAFIERSVGSGKVLLMTSSLDSEWNNLPVKAIFLPLLYQTLDYVAAKKKGQSSYLVGQPVTLENFPAALLKKDQYFIQSPVGERAELKSNYYEATRDPGIYEIKKRNRSLGYFAVNIDPKESDLTPATVDEFHEKIVAGTEDETQSATVASAGLSDQLEDHQKLWKVAIFSVILLLICETWLGNRTYR